MKIKRILANSYGVPATVSTSLSVESRVDFMTYESSRQPYPAHSYRRDAQFP